MLSVSRAQTTGEMQDLVMVVMMVREGMAVVLSSDLTQCLGGPSPGNGGGVGTPPAADQGLGEQSSDFSGLSPLVAPHAFISTEATTVTTVAERINIFAKYQLSSS